jgi:hypothetical protein
MWLAKCIRKVEHMAQPVKCQPILITRLYPWKLWNDNKPPSRMVSLERASFNYCCGILSCLKSEIWRNGTRDHAMMHFLLRLLRTQIFFPSEILKKPQTTTNQDQHHWKARSLYSVMVDCQVYHRTCCSCGSRRSSQIMPLWQFSTGFAVLRWQ